MALHILLPDRKPNEDFAIFSDGASKPRLKGLFKSAIRQALLFVPSILRPSFNYVSRYPEWGMGVDKYLAKHLLSMIPGEYFNTYMENIVDRILFGVIKFFWTFFHRPRSDWGAYLIPAWTQTGFPAALVDIPGQPQHAPDTAVTGNKRKRNEEDGSTTDEVLSKKPLKLKNAIRDNTDDESSSDSSLDDDEGVPGPPKASERADDSDSSSSSDEGPPLTAIQRHVAKLNAECYAAKAPVYSDKLAVTPRTLSVRSKAAEQSQASSRTKKAAKKTSADALKQAAGPTERKSDHEADKESVSSSKRSGHVPNSGHHDAKPKPLAEQANSRPRSEKVRAPAAVSTPETPRREHANYTSSYNDGLYGPLPNNGHIIPPPRDPTQTPQPKPKRLVLSSPAYISSSSSESEDDQKISESRRKRNKTVKPSSAKPKASTSSSIGATQVQPEVRAPRFLSNSRPQDRAVAPSPVSASARDAEPNSNNGTAKRVMRDKVMEKRFEAAKEEIADQKIDMERLQKRVDKLEKHDKALRQLLYVAGISDDCVEEMIVRLDEGSTPYNAYHTVTQMIRRRGR